MPYASEQQRKFFHANREKLERQGVNVDEWDRASQGKQLPTTAHEGLKQAYDASRRTRR